MVVPSQAAFTRRYRELSTAERAALVADMWAARGWATTRDGAVIVAERDGRTRRVAVVTGERRPSWVVATDEVDEVVVRSERVARRIREATPGQTPTVIGPVELRDRLLYAMDRETAASVHETHFDVGFGDPDERRGGDARASAVATADRGGDGVTDGLHADSGPSGGSTTGSTTVAVRAVRRRAARWLAASRSRHVRRVTLVGATGLVLVALGLSAVFWAPVPGSDLGVTGGAGPVQGGSAGPLATATTSATTSTPATAETDDDGPSRTPTTGGRSGPPPGLSSESITELSRLVDAHVTNARRHPTSRLEHTFEGPRFLTGFDTRRSGFDPDDTVRVVLHVRADHDYRLVRRTNFTGARVERRTSTVETYVDGMDGYRRTELDGDVRYARVLPSHLRDGYELFEDRSRSVLGTYLDTTESRVERVVVGGTVRYRVTAVGEPVRLAHETRGYRAVAIVTPRGTVTDLRVEYEHPGTDTTVRIDAAYVGGDDELGDPSWLGEARNATAG